MLKKYDNDIGRVVYFVAESHVDRRIRNPEVFVKTNDLDTAEILNYAKKTTWELQDGIFEENKMFLHIFTDGVFGLLEKNVRIKILYNLGKGETSM